MINIVEILMIIQKGYKIKTNIYDAIFHMHTSSFALDTSSDAKVAKDSRFWTSKYNDKQLFGVQHFDKRCRTAASRSII